MIVEEPLFSSHSRPNDSILRCGLRVCGNDPSKDGYLMAQNKPKLVSCKNLRSFISTPSPHLIDFFLRTYLYLAITGHFAIVIAICYLPLLLFSLFHWHHLKQPHDTSAPMSIHAQIYRRKTFTRDILCGRKYVEFQRPFFSQRSSQCPFWWPS